MTNMVFTEDKSVKTTFDYVSVINSLRTYGNTFDQAFYEVGKWNEFI